MFLDKNGEEKHEPCFIRIVSVNANTVEQKIFSIDLKHFANFDKRIRTLKFCRMC